MENKNISQIALEKIKESGIKPISKNVFNLRKVLFWSFVGFAVLVGTVSFAITLSILFSNDWYLYNKFGFGFILKSLPYFWLVCLLLFTLLGEFYYRKTLLGHRHRVMTIIGIYIILTVILGSILHLFGLGEIIEKSLSRNVPVYHIVVFDRNGFWSQPDEGLLYGKLIEVNGNAIKLVDSNNTVWNINIDSALIDKKVKIEVGEIIKIVGDQDDDTIFNADEIHPIGNSVNRDCCTVR
jgi:hypothetical protein